MKDTNQRKMIDTNQRKMIEWKTQKEISVEEWETFETQAHREFHFEKMMEYLSTGTDGTVYFDRENMLHSKKQEQLFYYILKREYIAVWKDIENLTVYFEVVANEIIAGAYNILTGEKVSRRILISNDTERAPYICSLGDIKRLKKKIYVMQTAPQRAK